MDLIWHQYWRRVDLRCCPAGMVTRDGEIRDNVMSWKVVDVPDLGYFITQNSFTGAWYYSDHPDQSSSVLCRHGDAGWGDRGQCDVLEAGGRA